MGRIHNLNRKVGRMGLLNLLYLTSMPTEHKNKYFVKCRYGKYFLCVSKGYKNDLPRSLRSTPFKSPDRALIVRMNMVTMSALIRECLALSDLKRKNMLN